MGLFSKSVSSRNIRIKLARKYNIECSYLIKYDNFSQFYYGISTTAMLTGLIKSTLELMNFEQTLVSIMDVNGNLPLTIIQVFNLLSRRL